MNNFFFFKDIKAHRVCALWKIVASINTLDIDNIYAFKRIFVYIYIYYIHQRNIDFEVGAR